MQVEWTELVHLFGLECSLLKQPDCGEPLLRERRGSVLATEAVGTHEAEAVCLT